MHTLFPNKVKLEPVSHRYYHDNGDEYFGFSKMYEYVCKKFDAESISRFVAKAKGVSASEIREEWDSKTENGTRIDEAIELYAKSGQILKENETSADLIRSVLDEYSNYNKCYEQLVVYNEKTRTAGSVDKTFIYSNRKDSAFGMSDFKCFEDVLNTDGTIKYFSEETLYVHRGWLNPPFEHLPNTKYTKISFQLSYYADHFEGLTGRKCKSLFIHLIDPIRKTHKKIPVMYMKNDVKLLLDTYSGQIINNQEPIQNAFEI